MKKNLRILIATICLGLGTTFVGCAKSKDKVEVKVDNKVDVQVENKAESKEDDTENNKVSNSENINNQEKEDKKEQNKEEINKGNDTEKNNELDKVDKKEEAETEKTEQKNPEKEESQKTEQQEKSYKAYYIDSTASFLEYKIIKGDKEILDPQTILNTVGKGLSIGPNTKVLSCTVTDYNTVILNLSKDIYDTKVGSGVGAMRIEGIARTYISALGAKNCIIQVEGEGYSDGHTLLDKFETVL